MSTVNIFDMSDTWNDAGETFAAIKMDVTDTASDAASNLLDLQVGGVSRFRVGKGAGAFFETDLIEQRRSTNPQAFRLYNTYTDSSNFERGFMRWNSNELEIGTEAGGTGDTRDVSFFRGGSQRLRLGVSNNRSTLFITGDGSEAAFIRSISEFRTGTIAIGINFGGGNAFAVIPGEPGTDVSGYISSARVWMKPSAQYTWGASNNANISPDTGLARNSAGVVRVTNGSTGTGELIFIVPTTDPEIEGALWNDNGTLSISAG